MVKQGIQKLLVVIIAMLTVSFCLTSHATGAIESDKPLTGTQLVYCPITFDIRDDTNGEFRDKITVYFTDITQGVSYNHTLSRDNDYLKGKAYEVQANTTYLIAISYKSFEKYDIVNEDGTEIQRFGATESGMTFHWVIKRKGEALSKPTAGGRNSEGDAIFSEFVEATSFIIDDEKYSKFLSVLGNEGGITWAMFRDHTGGTEEEWKAKSVYDRMCWAQLYLIFEEFADGPDYSYSFGSWEKVAFNFLYDIDNQLDNLQLRGAEGTDEVYNAFEKVIKWQYEYFLETGKFYNFMAPSEETEEVIETTPAISEVTDNGEKANADNTEKDIVTPTTKPDNSVVPVNQTTEVGSDKTIEYNPGREVAGALKKNTFTIILAVIVLVALFFFIRYRKKHNVDEDE